MSAPKILALAGSTRSGSLNRKLVQFAANAAGAAGADVRFIELRDLALPLFDEDLESAHGLPEGAKTLKAAMVESDGFLIASPEYNSSLSGVLKNALDWASRAETADEPPLAAFRGKAAALLSASPGGLGGLRGLVHLRAILGNMGVILLPEQIAIPSAHDHFDKNDRLSDPRKAAQVEKLAADFVAFLRRFRAEA